MTDAELLENLRMNFESSANWRRRKAEEYPNDNRNREAAESLDALAASVGLVSPDLAGAYAKLCADVNDCYRVVEIESGMTKDAGFRGHWDTAEEFIRAVIEEMTRDAWRRTA